MVALTNPGTMLFLPGIFSAVSEYLGARWSAIDLMTATFMVLTAIVDTSYALLAARIGHRLQDPAQSRARNRLSGGLLLLAAVVLVFINV